MVDQKNIDVNQPIGIVCHDAGAANQVLAMLERGVFIEPLLYFEGPALKLLRQSEINSCIVESLEELVKKVSTMITGTGWGADLEHNARVRAIQKNIHSIAVLDHWVNYRERFIREKKQTLPHELWVFDNYALEIASNLFTRVPVTLLPDYYTQKHLKAITPIENVIGNELCYLLEPARSCWGKNEQGEFQALRYFFEKLPSLNLPKDTRISLKPHPSDDLDKYNSFKKKWHGYEVVIDESDLISCLSRARWVAGVQTYALTVALQAKRTVFCSLPPWGPSNKLPHKGLKLIMNNLNHT